MNREELRKKVANKLDGLFHNKHSFEDMADRLIDLIQRNTESKDEWVSVEDRLPEVKEGNLSSDVVLVSGKYDYTMAVLAKKEGSNVWLKMQKYSDIIVDKITHWQPLPQPPKQGSQS